MHKIVSFRWDDVRVYSLEFMLCMGIFRALNQRYACELNNIHGVDEMETSDP